MILVKPKIIEMDTIERYDKGIFASTRIGRAVLCDASPDGVFSPGCS